MENDAGTKLHWVSIHSFNTNGYIEDGQWPQRLLANLMLETPPCPAGTRRCNTCEAGLPGHCHTKNVVYKIICNLCDQNPSVYIGESKRRVRERFNEHLRDAKNKTSNTPLGDHISRRHPDSTITPTSFKISIERVCKDVADLKIAESIEIRNQRPCLNTQISSWPLLHPPPYTPPMI